MQAYGELVIREGVEMGTERSQGLSPEAAAAGF